jgi:Stage II sporulation protein E (SpoIIE)
VNGNLARPLSGLSSWTTAACVTHDPGTRVSRFAFAGHPPALRPESGEELTAERTGAALGLAFEVGCRERAERLGVVTECFSTPTGWSKRAGAGAAAARTD